MEIISNSEKERLQAERLLACSPLSSDTDKEIFHMSLLKTVLPFLTNQA